MWNTHPIAWSLSSLIQKHPLFKIKQMKYKVGEKVIIYPEFITFQGIKFSTIIATIEDHRAHELGDVGMIHEKAISKNFCIKGCKSLENYLRYFHTFLNGDRCTKYYTFIDGHWSCTYNKLEGITELTEAEFNQYMNLGTPISYKLLKDLPDISKGTIGKIVKESIFFKSRYSSEEPTYYSLSVVKEKPEWFQPVYNILPKINGYEATIISSEKIKYGCVEIDLGHLADLYHSSKRSFSDRTVTEIKLSSNVVITIEQIEQILNYFK